MDPVEGLGEVGVQRPEDDPLVVAEGVVVLELPHDGVPESFGLFGGQAIVEELVHDFMVAPIEHFDAVPFEVQAAYHEARIMVLKDALRSSMMRIKMGNDLPHV